MLYNYFKVSFRNIFRHKVFSFINIFGLSIGLTCCLLLVVYVQDELSYDTFHQKSNRIYRVKYDINDFVLARSPMPLAGAMTEYFSEIENTARAYNRSASVEIRDGDQSIKKFEEDRIFFVDSSLLDILTFEFVVGNPATALQNPFSAILVEELATKYFGNENPLGKTIYVAGNHPFKITGVVKDYPGASHVHFNIIAPFDNLFDVESGDGQVLKQSISNNWVASYLYTYALLKPGQRVETINERFGKFYEDRVPENMKLNQKWSLVPMTDTRLYAQMEADTENPSNISFIYIFTTIALLVLLIACINFINLSTAKSLKRTKEIGIRKVLGAWKAQLVGQFLGESFIINLVAAGFALMFSYLLLGTLNELTGKTMQFSQFFIPINIGAFVLIIMLTTILAGAYPAFFVTKIDPANSLKGILSNSGDKGVNFRKVLVVVQFTISIVLISGAMIVFNQLEYMRSRPMGFDKAQIINIPLFSDNFNNFFGGVDGKMRQRLDAFEEELKRMPSISGSTLSNNPLGLGGVYNPIVPEGYTREDNILAPLIMVDYDFLDVYQLNLIAGRNFDKSYGTDHLSSVIINESAVIGYQFGTPEDALGKSMSIGGKETKVVGVVKDFNFTTLQNPIGPLLMHISVGSFSSFSIKIGQKEMPQTLSALEVVWNKHFPEKVFEYTFLDETIAQSYTNELRLGKIVGYFAFIAILISSMGSYGLIMFLAQQKMKEIGIRKVLGASILNILLLLGKGFATMIMISLIIAVPIVYFFMSGWLEDFSFRITIGPESFVLAGLLSLLIVGITISYQTITAAFANPVRSLRTE